VFQIMPDEFDFASIEGDEEATLPKAIHQGAEFG